jgi:hypothetical protein
MMKRKQFFSFVVVIVIAFCGCKKEVLKVHPELEGIWTSENYTSSEREKIVVDSKGNGLYERIVNSEITINEEGKARIKKDVLKIGKEEFKIIAYPTYDNEGNYFIVTDKGIFFGVYAVVDPQLTSNGIVVTFSWTNKTTPSNWVDEKQIDIKRAQDETWTNVDCNGFPSNYSLTNFQNGVYHWRIKSTRGPNSSQYSPIQTFLIQ